MFFFLFLQVSAWASLCRVIYVLVRAGGGGLIRDNDVSDVNDRLKNNTDVQKRVQAARPVARCVAGRCRLWTTGWRYTLKESSHGGSGVSKPPPVDTFLPFLKLPVLKLSETGDMSGPPVTVWLEILAYSYTLDHFQFCLQPTVQN